MTEISPRSRAATLLRIAVVVLACLWLAWKVSVSGLAAQAELSRNPKLLALFAGEDHPDAAARLADTLLRANKDAAAQAMAREAVLNDPLNVRALRVYGLSMERQGSKDSARPVLRRAETMGWRDTPALLWGLQDAILRGAADRVLAISDALGRRQVYSQITRTIFFASLIDPRLQVQFVSRLAENPSWRPTFFNDISTYLTPAHIDGMEQVLGALRTTKAPPSKEEILKYVSRAAELGEYQRSRSFWATALAIPAQQLAAPLFDSNLARVGSRPVTSPAGPFEWQVNPDLGNEIGFEQDADGTTFAMDLEAPTGTTILSQTTLLAPGAHVLRTRIVEGDGQNASSGWTITCLPSNQSLLRNLPGNGDEMSKIGFTVPDRGCQAQVIRLVVRDMPSPRPVAIAGITVD